MHSFLRALLLTLAAGSIWGQIEGHLHANNAYFFGAASALYVSLDHLKLPCYKYECCVVGDSKVSWIRDHGKGVKEMESLLSLRLFGQHIAARILNQQLGAYMLDPDPTKPFVIHISGKTGTGKNHIANLIAQARYVEGIQSKYVLKVIGSHRYSSMEPEKAQQKLQDAVSKHVGKCKYSLVIIDEAEKLPNGTLNSIGPFLDINPNVGGVDYRKTIFIFLSNTAGTTIKEYTEAQLEQGRSREDITVHEMETLIQDHLYRTGELKQSSLISRYQLDAFIPMLPLEKRHVQLCAQEQLRKRRNKCGCQGDDTCIERKAMEIANEVDYAGRFSRSGCKKILTKANLLCPLDYTEEL